MLNAPAFPSPHVPLIFFLTLKDKERLHLSTKGLNKLNTDVTEHTKSSW